jgi:predicted small secreted protein
MGLTSSIVTGFLITIADNGMSTDSIIQNNTTENIIQNVKSVNDTSYNIEYSDLYNELSTYSDLNKNWDGYNGIRPSDDIIETVKLFLNILKNNKIHHPRIMLSGSGEVALFWKNNKNYIEIDFDLKNKLSFFYELDTDIYGEDDVVISGLIPQKLNYSLSKLFKVTSSNRGNSLIDNENYNISNSFLTA